MPEFVRRYAVDRCFKWKDTSDEYDNTNDKIWEASFDIAGKMDLITETQ
jgi:hypothetical protein